MRWFIAFFVASFSGCVLPLTSDGSSSGAGAADAGSACQTGSACSDCVSCALSSPCATLYTTCEESADCSAIDQCFNNCGLDATCRQQCYDDNPSGASAYHAVTNCVYCDQCPTACAGQCM